MLVNKSLTQLLNVVRWWLICIHVCFELRQNDIQDNGEHMRHQQRVNFEFGVMTFDLLKSGIFVNIFQ